MTAERIAEAVSQGRCYTNRTGSLRQEYQILQIQGYRNIVNVRGRKVAASECAMVCGYLGKVPIYALVNDAGTYAFVRFWNPGSKTYQFGHGIWNDDGTWISLS